MYEVQNRKYKKTLAAHMVVKNEDQWIWYAIMSVIDYVDKMIIFDTGSRDKTVDVINRIIDYPQYNSKIVFEEVGSVTIQEFPKIRQKQLDMTDTDYIIIVDGDEIWWKEGISEFREVIEFSSPSRIAVRFICPCSDIYHYRDFGRELYTDDKVGIYKGSISTRGISMSIPGLSCIGDYGIEGYRCDKGGIEEYDAILIDSYYFHCSKLRRSSAVLGDESIPYRRRKITDDWDFEFPKDYKYPEVFYLEHPDIVPDPFTNKDNFVKMFAKRLARVYRRMRYR